ncbi:uncharacterized protein VTP21DRAFT_9104 [Calcarisporiella thermophila]|uniref:uncharacterized protein n=1 Tax=Calcarisporiella thermophila TaxID=911321 RepID=UPI003743FB47
MSLSPSVHQTASNIRGAAVNSTNHPEAVTPPSSSAAKSFFAEKSWKFYTTIALAVVVAGAGYWYLTASSSAILPKSARKKKKAEKKASKGKKDSASVKDAKGDDLLNLSEEEIESLSKKERTDAAQSLKTTGNAKFGAKQYQEAIIYYSKAIEFHPDPVYYGNRAACYANIGEIEKVISDCNEALSMDPVYIKALNRRAQAYEKLEEDESALYDFMAVCILDGFKNEVAAASMERMIKKVAEKKAKEMWINKKPKLPSKTFISTYFDSYRKETDGLESLSETDDSGDAYYLRARNFLNLSKYEEAMQACFTALERGCEKWSAQASTLKGTFLSLQGNSQEALEYFKKAIEFDPKYTKSYIKSAGLYLEQNDSVTAFKQFDDAIAIDPNDPDIYFHRGQLHFLTGDLAAATKDYAHSIQLDPDFPYGHIQLAIAQYRQGSVSAATTTFRQALKQFPRSLEVLNYYGEVLLDQQKFSEAQEWFEKAREMDKTNPLPLVNLGHVALQRDQDFKKAEEYCLEALKVDPDSDVVLATYSHLLMQQGRQTDAKPYMERSISQARTESELAQALQFLLATQAQEEFMKRYPEHAARLSAMAGL